MGEEKKGDVNKDYVLVSCVGSTDPIKTLSDGPILHICRYYSPKKVYLLYTSEMYEKNKLPNDNKMEIIEYTLKKSLIGYDIPEVEIIETDIIDAHHYDVFHEYVKRIFKTAKDEYPNSNILINLTSGTQQITSNFMNYYLSDNDPMLIPIQVSTPKKGSNDGTESNKESTTDDLIEQNLDNEYLVELDKMGIKQSEFDKLSKFLDDNPNLKPSYRLIYPNFMRYHNERVLYRIKEHVRKHKFDFALELLSKELRNSNPKIKAWLEFAVSKIEVDREKSDKLIDKLKAMREKVPRYMDRRNYNNKSEKLPYNTFDYFSLAKHKYYTNDINSFILMMEPFFISFYICIIRDKVKLPLDEFLIITNEKIENIEYQSYKVKRNTEYEKNMKKKPKNDVEKNYYVSKVYLDNIIDYKLEKYNDKDKEDGSNEKDIYNAKLYRKLIYIREKYKYIKGFRNLIAHNLEQIKKNTFKSKGVKYIDEFIKDIQYFITDIYNDDEFDFKMLYIYENIEKRLIDLLNQE